MLRTSSLRTERAGDVRDLSADKDTAELSAEELAEIEKKYDEGAATRAWDPGFAAFLRYVALTFAVYHYLTAGFALPPDYWHMGWHLSGLFILIYALFPLVKTATAFDLNTGALAPGRRAAIWTCS